MEYTTTLLHSDFLDLKGGKDDHRKSKCYMRLEQEKMKE